MSRYCSYVGALRRTLLRDAQCVINKNTLCARRLHLVLATSGGALVRCATYRRLRPVADTRCSELEQRFPEIEKHKQRLEIFQKIGIRLAGLASEGKKVTVGRSKRIGKILTKGALLQDV